ncbi:hypothetical protein [Nocardioides marmotae]|uniref:hypothetical protein n=1 Tax=Nocardioides marmotae TaxID=2663857 RepID=UPI001659C3F4|nr:hypothetical protein [Nocardioides marmotae]MBC9734751.1 hypothetical protein [Nocardioides marmotae]
MRDLQVLGRRSSILQLEALSIATGECVLVAGDPGQGHTALALAVTGRLSGLSGTVALIRDDGSVSTDPAALRRVTAVVDLPGISEPDDVSTIGTVAAEERAYAHRPSGRRAVRQWLATQRLSSRRHERVEDVPAADRTRVLASLAAERRGVRFIVLCLPDRHGGEPADWWALAQALASVGFGVLVQCQRSSARDLGALLPPAQGPEARRRPLVEALRTTPGPAIPAPTAVARAPDDAPDAPDVADLTDTVVDVPPARAAPPDQHPVDEETRP